MKIKDLPKFERPRGNYLGAGHRKRLRERFLQSGLNGFLDYEIIELLLTLGTPRKDCKQIAKEAIKMFGGLRGVLDAPFEELQGIKGIGPNNAFGLKLFQAVSSRYAREQIPKKITFNSSKAVANFLQKSIGREKKEHFVILSLNSGNSLIKISNVSIGILNANLVHPREVFKEAIQASAAYIIIAHNHPSGNTEPSEEDIKTTKDLVATGRILGIELLDHLIVTKFSFLSFREKGLLF